MCSSFVAFRRTRAPAVMCMQQYDNTLFSLKYTLLTSNKDHNKRKHKIVLLLFTPMKRVRYSKVAFTAFET